MFLRGENPRHQEKYPRHQEKYSRHPWTASKKRSKNLSQNRSFTPLFLEAHPGALRAPHGPFRPPRPPGGGPGPVSASQGPQASPKSADPVVRVRPHWGEGLSSPYPLPPRGPVWPGAQIITRTQAVANTTRPPTQKTIS